VTGTHGKTTVTRLITHVLKSSGENAFTAGNERHSEQLLSLLADKKGINKNDLLILEISNRQLKIPFEKYPDIAVITNIYPNHLDEHESFDEYRKVKMRIAEKLEGRKVIVGGEDAQLLEWAQKKHATIIGSDKMQWIKDTFQLPSSLAGEHNLSNTAIAFAVCEQLAVNIEQFQRALNSFPGVEKRQEVIFKTDRVQVINDSIATTPTATLVAVKTFQNTPLFLIVGGDDKNIPQASWDMLSNCLRSLDNITVALLPGTIHSKFTYEKVLKINSLEEAFVAAQNFVLQQKSQVTILLSPGGEAFYTKFLVGKSLDKLVKDYFSSSITLSLG
jgi:UDP-N-acetylmuramoylalanine--D-glutamate ligase